MTDLKAHLDPLRENTAQTLSVNRSGAYMCLDTLSHYLSSPCLDAQAGSTAAALQVEGFLFPSVPEKSLENQCRDYATLFFS